MNARDIGVRHSGATAASSGPEASQHHPVGSPAMSPAQDADRSILESPGAILSVGGGIAGLALARIGLLTGSYSSYNQTDAGLLTDGPSFFALIVMAVLLGIVALSKARLKRSTVTILALACMLAESVILLVQGILAVGAQSTEEVRFCLSTALTLASSGSMFYWLRRARGANSVVAVIYVFGALIASEIMLVAIALLPTTPSFFIASAASLLQLGCLALTFRGTPMRDLQRRQGPAAYFGYVRTVVDDKRFLVSTAIGIGLLGMVDGFLRGYPDGAPIQFTTATRLGYAVLTIAISMAIIFSMTRGRTRAMTMGIWVTLELVACVALLCFALFPTHLEYGALFATTLNALMVGLVFYTVVAFESKGWRDPYYYALAGWLVWLGCRSVARLALMLIYPLYANDPAANAFMGMLLLISTQVVFGSCLRDVGSYGCANLAAQPMAAIPRPARMEETAPGPGSSGKAEPPRANAAPGMAFALGAQNGTGPGIPTSAEGDASIASPTAEQIRARILADMARDRADQAIHGGSPANRTVEADRPAETPRPAGSGPKAAPAMQSAAPSPASPSGAAPTPSPSAKDAVPPTLHLNVPQPESPASPIPLVRLMGLDDAENIAAVSQSEFGQAVESLGQRFMLSEREIEVLMLYALGHTQKRVAEELHISQGTAHTHIKRIYAKTGLHSRQEVIDFLTEYSS